VSSKIKVIVIVVFYYELLRICSVLHKVRLLTIVPIYKCYGISVMQSILNGHKSGNMANDKFTMTTSSRSAQLLQQLATHCFQK
jgi:hypothetical protein